MLKNYFVPLELFKEYLKKIDRIDKKISKMGKGIKKLRKRVTDLENEVAGLREDVDGLKRDVGSLKSEVVGIKNSLDRLMLSLEEEAIEYVRWFLEKYGIKVSLESKFICDMEFDFYSPGRNKKNSLTVHGGIARGKLRWRITKPFSTGVELSFGWIKEFKDGIFQTEGDENWFMALRKYGEIYRKVNRLKYKVQDTAFRPAFCTWRARVWYLVQAMRIRLGNA